jgi:Bifunctional DNA primase/polymerase, N-terminal
MIDQFSAARALVGATFSVIPCAPDTKLPIGYLLPVKRDGAGNAIINPSTGRPRHTWKDYQYRLPTDAELDRWFRRHVARPAIVQGGISRNAETIDFDKPAGGAADPFDAWYALVQKYAPLLASRLCIVHTPSGAHHVPYRCPEVTIPSNHVLAAKYWVHPSDAAQDRTETLIETRGTGGFALCPPGAGYRYLQGTHLDLPNLAADERDLLHTLARHFTDGTPRPKECVATASGASTRDDDELRPGDEYTARASPDDLVALLCRHGWQRGATHADGKTELIRPGKDAREGISGDVAVIGGIALFTQFSSNGGPFRPKKGHTAFSVLTMLEHAGHAGDAARALAAQGYGTPR